jgi:hypothetical protein
MAYWAPTTIEVKGDPMKIWIGSTSQVDSNVTIRQDRCRILSPTLLKVPAVASPSCSVYTSRKRSITMIRAFYLLALLNYCTKHGSTVYTAE